LALSPQSVLQPFTERPADWIGRTLATPLGRLAFPSLSDLFFVALIGWLFIAGGDGWKGLLLDGDCGWHIRTGEYILDTGTVPRVDLFSFTKGGQPWFAWEWLSDVCFAILYRWAGLKGIVLAAGVLIAAFATIVLRRIFAQGANLFVALLVGLLSVGSASIHFLARPHVFTLLFLAISMWIIERDRKVQSRRIWLLVPLTVLWTNMHGGFLALIAVLGIVTLGTAVETWLGEGPGWRGVARYAALTTACALSSVINPYGIQLHIHIAAYLRSDWIRNVIQEFQSPSFRSESVMQFEALLFVGLIVAALRLRQKRVVEALWIVAFAHLALGSVRHIPIFVIVAAPIIAADLTAWWRRWSATMSPRSVFGIVEQMGRDLAPGFRRNTVWPCLAVVALASIGESKSWPVDFPDVTFPTRMVRNYPSLLTASHRVFTYDQWADYLIFNDPKRKVFIDGRSDFFGPDLGDEYLRAMGAHWDWREVLDKYRIDVVLAPVAWSLATVLKLDPSWRVVADDRQAVLFVREQGRQPAGSPGAAASETPVTARVVAIPAGPLVVERPKFAKNAGNLARLPMSTLRGSVRD